MKSRLTLAAAVAAIAFAGVSLGGCAPHAASTTVTAAEVATTPPLELPAPEGVAAASDVPTGKLVCRTKSAAEGTSELFLDWNGDEAKGLLRRVAPSGMVYLQPVKAERASGMIVADDASEADLVVHAATVRQANGKQLMRLGDGSESWSICE